MNRVGNWEAVGYAVSSGAMVGLSTGVVDREERCRSLLLFSAVNSDRWLLAKEVRGCNAVRQSRS